MKRIGIGIALFILGVTVTCVWLAHGGSRTGSLQAGFIGRTNVAGGGYSVLGLTNRTSRDVAFKVEVQALGPQGWGNVLYNTEGPNSVCTGWIGGHSNALVQVAAPERDVRFCLTYERVPNRLENYISWSLVALRMKPPFPPHSMTVLLSPGNIEP